MPAASPQRQFAEFLGRYAPPVAAIAKRALTKMRALVPGATEIVYDNYNALVIGFGPTDRASDAIVSIAIYPKWVRLFFLDGVRLPDPEKLLQGSGAHVRSIRLDDAGELDRPAVRTLVAQAVARSRQPIEGRRRMIVKSISKKQRPRRAR